MKLDAPKVPKQDGQKGWCNKPTKLKLQSILTRKIWCSQNATNQSNSTVELVYMRPRGLTRPPAVTLTKLLKYKKRLLPRCLHHFRLDLINNVNLWPNSYYSHTVVEVQPRDRYSLLRMNFFRTNHLKVNSLALNAHQATLVIQRNMK